MADALRARMASRRLQTVAAVAVAVLGPVLAVLTALAVAQVEQGRSALWLRLIVLADIVYVLALAALVLTRLARVIAARRARSAGSRLHLRLVTVFAALALVPSVLVAVFATVTINLGLEGWFSERVRSVVAASLEAARAYRQEHRDDLVTDALAIARVLDQAKLREPLMDEGTLRVLLASAQGQIQRGLKEAYVIDGAGRLVARGARSYLFDYEQPDAEALAKAASGEPVVIEDWRGGEFRALVRLDAFVDRYLYISRAVNGRLLALLDEARRTGTLYQQLERDRGRLLFEFALIYLAFAVLLILAAVWMGLWFAERLSRPVGQLAGAAQRLAGGDFTVRVPEGRGDDEISMLGRIFNRMTRELKTQRDALLEAHRTSEAQRRLFDSVLSGVTTGVIGLDREGRIAFVNPAARKLLALRDDALGKPLALLVPEFMGLMRQLAEGEDDGGEGAVARGEVALVRAGRKETLLVRIAERRGAEGELEGHVITFDDVTDLVAAQRMAAWGDVARRIAHEIKNPLTPIQLSAERIRRKFRARAGEDAEALEQLTQVIIRQTEDLRRIVDEFSRFARMPEPEKAEVDLVRLLRDAVILQEGALAGIRLSLEAPEGPVPALLDATMIGQALTNLIKNAGEAIAERRAAGPEAGWEPEIRLVLELEGGRAVIRIIDNGIGLPAERERLFEPYVTTRASGTGLGLAIVRKIIEEHGGTLALEDAPGGQGAMAVVVLPLRRGRDRRRATGGSGTARAGAAGSAA
ncbi:MAG: PAS domain-containing sensor histidine kinase [Alphaproteobacteria bacterium]|nr:MAG: PAS domain-containing sensor histidine kinase [Alphaproteobacteria bacterium]